MPEEWPFGRRRKKGLGFFDDIEEEFARMQEEIERMMKDMEKRPGAQAKRYGPFVYGFSMRVGPDGKPVFEEFGNVKPPSKTEPAGEREPLVDVIEEDKTITVLAELPGIEKQDIRLNATEDSLSVKVDTVQRKYSKVVELPAKVKPDSAKANFKNGVLEVKLERKEAGPPKAGSQVRIE